MIKVNGNSVVFKKYPNNEKSFYIDQEHLDETNVVIFKYENDDSLIELMMVKNYIDEYAPASLTVLYIAYMPYSRLDRTVEYIAFTLKYIGKFINSLGFTGIAVFEPHSDVTCGVLNNAGEVELTKIIFEDAVSSHQLEFNADDDFICYPDATAHKRYSKIGNFNAIIGMKDRDFKTGFINSLELFVPMCKDKNLEAKSVSGKNVVIIDDLCSKGGTFIMTAKELRKLGAKSISLVVAHCEDSILDGDILKTDLIDRVFTTNTIITHEKAGDHAVNGKMYIADFESYL